MPCSSWRNIGKQSGKKKKDRDSSTQKKGHAKAFRLPFLLYKIQGRCSNLYRHYHFTPTSLVNFPHKTHRGYLRNAEKRINKAKVRMISTQKKKKTPNLYYLKRKLSHSWGSKIYQANKCPNLPDRARTQFPKAERIPSSYTCFFLRKINRSCLDTKTFIYPIMYVLRHILGTA